MLDAASELMTARGVRAVGMDDVRDRAEVSLRALYGIFPTKQDLVAAWLDDRHDRFASWLTGATRDAPLHAPAQVAAAFGALERWAAHESFCGCVFVRSVAEQPDDRTYEIARAHKQWLRDFFLDRLQACGVPAAQPLSLQLAVLFDGAMVQAALGAGPDAARAARELAVLAVTTQAAPPADA